MGLVHAIVHPHHVPHLQICSTSLVLIDVVLQIKREKSLPYWGCHHSNNVP